MRPGADEELSGVITKGSMLEDSDAIRFGGSL